MVRAGAARCVSIGRTDECAVRRTATAAVRYGRFAAEAEAGRSRASRARGTAAAAQALSMVLFDARGQRRHAPSAARRARFFARLLPPQERGLESQHALFIAGLDRGRT